MPSSRLVDLDRVHSSYLLLATLAGLVLAAVLLYQVGVIGWLVAVVGRLLRASIRGGFLLWERLLAWASWPLLLAVVLALLVLGRALVPFVPVLAVGCALLLLAMGVLACLAYMFIDLERYEVARGYKAVHNPLMGQAPALYLTRYGHQVGVPLLAVAAAGVIGGFALLNQGLYEAGGGAWYRVGKGQEGPAYVDFLAYALINLLGIVDVLDLARSRDFLRVAYVRQAAWPASTLLVAFKVFFTFVLLQQIFASLRQGKLLAETIADFFSPHEPIHERARKALPQYGPSAIAPLLLSLRSVGTLTREQRDAIPPALATIGPSAIPILVHHLGDPNDDVRAVAAGTLGRLHAFDTLHLVVPLAQDANLAVRQSAVEALGALAAGGPQTAPRKRWRTWSLRTAERLERLLGWGPPRVNPLPANPIELAVTTLQGALADESAGVRMQSAQALGQIGPRAAGVVPDLIGRLKDEAETVRCQAAEALGQVGAAEEGTVAALTGLLEDPSPAVKGAAARALGALKKAAAPAVPALVPLLQDRDEEVRSAAAAAIAAVGPLDEQATGSLVEGLESPDSVVRAQTAEALGTIGAAAQEAAPALVEALADDNDRVRARAVKALGQMGEGAAEVAVPSLKRALRDQDNWVSALAAEALGQMGESADDAVPALIRSLKHANPLVRGNSAEALGKLGQCAAGARQALEKASRDEEGGVRAQAVRALGKIGAPTPSSQEVALSALRDDDPGVRRAAVEAVGEWGDSNEAVVTGLTGLLEDANDPVKVEAVRVLPRLAGATPAVIDGLCRRLLEDDSAWVQEQAALALGKLGPAAVAAGEPLLRAAQTGEASVREQAMRAIALIQPPETLQAFSAGLRDASGDIRKVASGGWMKAEAIPEEVIPALVEALRDPEIQVRANAAHALGRLDQLPAEAVPLLIECAAHASVGLRMNAAVALKRTSTGAVSELMERLVEDGNLRVRLIAASALLATDAGHEKARAVLLEAWEDPTPRVRKGVLEVVQSLGEAGATLGAMLKEHTGNEADPEVRAALARLGEPAAQADGVAAREQSG
jgi:HEAT repeat protein